MYSLNQSLTGNNYTYKQQDPDYKGEQFNPILSDGPLQNRRCTDCLCCLLYLTFWVGLVIIAFVAFTTGNPRLLATPFDSAGFQCGISQHYQNTPYVYYKQSNPSVFGCISACPSNINDIADLNQYQCVYNSVKFPCALFGAYNTTRIIDICFPLIDSISSQVNTYIGFMEKSISDLKLTWKIQLSILFMGFLVSIILLFMLKYLGGCIIWSILFLYFVILTGFGVTCFLMSNNPDLANQYITESNLQSPQALRNIAYIAWSVDGLSLIILICSFRKLRTAILIIKAAADFTKQQWKTIFIPIIMFAMISIFFTFWIIVSIYIFSSGEISSCNNGSPYGCINWNVGVKRCLGYYFFGLFWNCQFAIALSQFVIASTASFWYFGHLNKIPLHNPISRSFFRGIVYHVGSLAYGSLILCIMWILQLLFQFLHWILKKQTISTNPVQNAILKCGVNWARCCLACFERFMRFISKNAFIMMALSGSGFCQSAHQAFYLIIRVRAEHAITNSLTDIIMYFGKLFITIICTFSGYLMITKISYFSDYLFSPFMPTLMFFIISYVVATFFMDVFSMGADTILMCYSIEMDINRGITKSCPPALDKFRAQYG